ncbi:RNA-splicing factor, partial [Spiromyces aspiralis]
MYNGIGLPTPRGSGTNGYVTRNLSTLRTRQDFAGKPSDMLEPPKPKRIDKDILLHEMKRQVEIKCMELMDELEEKCIPNDEIDAKVEELRSQLLKELEERNHNGALESRDSKSIKVYETHRAAEVKMQENTAIARALRIGDDYVEGSAFDRELQELKKQERRQEWELRQEQERRSSHGRRD